MDKRYQVFISSTYADLMNECSKVIQTLMEMDCMPAGMELFPAIDDEQFNFIKRVIDDCDYYIVIIGGRYCSISEDGLSYTEKEFDYACEKGIKVIALLHNDPNKIPVEKSDIDPETRKKLDNFRKKVSTQRLVKFWDKPEDLPGLVALSLSKTIKTYPAIGWVRSNEVGNPQLLAEINELRKENEQLKNENLSKSENIDLSTSESLAGLEDKYKFFGDALISNSEIEKWEIKITWGELFFIISPYLMKHPEESHVKSYLAYKLSRKVHSSAKHPEMDSDNFDTLKIHLNALNLINIKSVKNSVGSMSLYWSLTEKGNRTMKELRSVKK